jgi:hypothetical protein
VPARFGKKAQNAVFVIAVNQTIEPVRIGLDEFAIVSLDKKQPNNPNRAKVILALSPVEVAEETAVMFQSPTSPPPQQNLQWLIYDKRGRYVGQAVSDNPLLPLIQKIQEEEDRKAAARNWQAASTMIEWIERTSFVGGVISPGGHLYGILYFPKISGASPMLMYSHKDWRQAASLKLPLGTGLTRANSLSHVYYTFVRYGNEQKGLRSPASKAWQGRIGVAPSRSKTKRYEFL